MFFSVCTGWLWGLKSIGTAALKVSQTVHAQLWSAKAFDCRNQTTAPRSPYLDSVTRDSCFLRTWSLLDFELVSVGSWAAHAEGRAESCQLPAGV